MASARDREAFWVRWTTRVMARPWRAVIGVSAILLFLAIPLLSIETGTQAIKQFPTDSDVRVGNELASEHLGGGTDPVQIVASFEAWPPGDRAAVAGFVRTIEATPGVSSVTPPAFSGDSALIQATPSAPQRVRRDDRPGRAAARQPRPRAPRWPMSPASTSAAKPLAVMTRAG